MPSLRVSLVICTYNRAASLPRTLQALDYLRYPARETLVVVGPCTDNTLDVLKPWQGRVRILHCPEANLSMARNIGIDHAAGDIVAFTDDDGLPEANWLDTLVAAFEADPRLGGAGGHVRDHTGVAYQTRHIRCNRWGEAQFFDRAPEAEHPDWFPSLIGVNSAFRRAALADIGGFDEEYAYFLDETDVCLRLLEKGWRLRTLDDAEVHHAYAPSHLRTPQRVPTTLYLTARSKIYYALRHQPQPPLRPLAIVQRQRDDLLASVQHLRAAGKIDAAAAQRLRDDIWRASADAAHDAFAHPAGRTVALRPADPAAWLPAQPPWPAGPKARLLLISRNYPPQPIGGIARYTHTLAHALARLGHEVHVIAQTTDSVRTDFEDGVWVHRIEPTAAHDCPPPPPDRPALPLVLRQWTHAVAHTAAGLRQRLGIDTAIAALWDVEAYDLARQPGWRVLTYLVTSYALNLPHKPDWGGNPHYLRQHVQPIIQAEGWLLRHSHALLASTQQIWHDVQATYPELGAGAPVPTVHHVPFGIPDDPAAAPAGASAAAASAAACTVLFVGRFEPRKGIDLVLHAIAQLAPQYPNVHWRLIGNDRLPHPEQPHTTYRQLFESQHRGQPWLARVHFEGEVGDAALLRAYRECDLFIAPSRYESFGLIYLEAMRAGKPCIGGAGGGGGELLSPDIGVAVGTDGPPPLIDALQALIEQPQRRAAMGQRARAHYLAHYSDHAFAQRLLRALELGC
ncbi:glycosyltransferase [Tepidimonas aquatica]|uniref:Glycogen synthase n=1 Tax=Tepidimonas aquatica TaxID=247482 RepID=A0A554WJQ3_9BURK|nr:glycosyltransferase [Tepidimonas aquatica]TSE23828.1 Glycogen synthase [Tepidimonas aquatica]